MLVLVPSIAGVARAQHGGFDFTVGRWWPDSTATVYAAAYHTQLAGPVDFGLGIALLDDSRSPLDRSATGPELTIGLGRSGRGPYAVGSGGLGVRHTGRNLDAHWSTGVGFAFPVLPFASVSVEARYRVEDESLAGFWRLLHTDRRGVVLGIRVAAGSRIGAAGAPRSPRPTFEPPTRGEVTAISEAAGASAEAARVASAVVQTAIDAMGTPYVWGGDGTNGYDCSGLIQYAYGEHGLVLPRISRDQARSGVHVDRELETLRPGDILGFAVEGPGVSHVGLYVGEGQFIHSASSGVRLSILTATDPDSRWWRDRWVSVRRIIQ